MKRVYQIVQNIITKLDNDINEVTKFAESKGLSINVNRDSKFYIEIMNAFPELHFNSINTNLCNGIDSIVSSINIRLKMLYPDAINSIHFDSINEKKKTVKLNKIDTYANYWFEKYFFKIDGNNSIYFSKENIIKEYKNGSVVYQLNDEQFNNFLEVINFSTPETDQIINAIQPEDKLKYLECTKINCMNEYMVIHDIKDRLNIRSLIPVNYYHIFKALSM